MRKATILRKAERLRRCIARVHEVYDDQAAAFEKDFTQQDSVILNVQRACEQTIDIAQALIAEASLSRPTDNGELFEVLAQNDIISPEISVRLKAMVGFRNVAVHEYQPLNLDIVRSVIQHELDLLIAFAATALAYVDDPALGYE